MSLGALLGTIFGILLIVVAAVSSIEDPLIFIHFASLCIVLGGTIANSFMSFQSRYVIISFKAIWWMMKKPKSTREGLNEEIGRIIKWAYLVQQKGLPALENEIKSVKSNDAVMRYCLECIAGGHKPEDLRLMMETAIESEYERTTVPVQILKTMGGTAPAFGMIGTLIGLVGVLQGMGMGGDMAKTIGNGMAVALITTLYGVIFARLIFLPAASTLQQKEEIEYFRNTMVVEGLIMLSEKKSPRYMQDRLNSFLDPQIHFDIDKQLRA
jgi:chemotaxis protein MotA